MSRLLPATLALLLPTLVFAQEEPAAPGPARETVWVVKLRDEVVGKETATEETEGDKVIYASKAEVNLTGQPWAYEQSLRVRAKDRGLIEYGLSSGLVTATAKRDEKGVALEALYMGKVTNKRADGDGPFFVLDNVVFSHYENIARYAHEKKKDASFSFVAIVPQAVRGLDAVFEPGETETVTVKGEKREVRRASIKVQNLLVTLRYDAADGRAYHVDVPSQRIEAHVEGWVGVPQETAPPKDVPWVEHEDEVPAPQGALQATFTFPKGVETPPVVLLVQGSGPHDRDETIGPNKPFRDLAHGLARHGIATLRYDKRTYMLMREIRAGGETREQALKKLTTLTLHEETTEDAIAALAWLAKHEDAGPLFLLGHSLGAMAAPRIAQGAKRLDGVILLAAPGRKLDELVYEQTLFQAGVQGLNEEQAKERGENMVRGPIAKMKKGELQSHQRVLGMTVYYWLDILKVDVPAELAKVTQPVLLLQGEKDCQVRVTDYDLLEAVLKKRSGASYEGRKFATLNHLFHHVEGKGTGAEYLEEGSVAQPVIDFIAEWVKRQPPQKD